MFRQMAVSAIDESTTGVTGAGFVDVGSEIQLNGDYSSISFEVYTDGAALTDFKLLVKTHGSGSFHDYLSGSEWTSTGIYILRWSSAALGTLGDGETEAAIVLVEGVESIKFQAKTAGTTDVQIYGLAKG